jgi:tRNA pseudouridine38-40 synthase
LSGTEHTIAKSGIFEVRLRLAGELSMRNLRLTVAYDGTDFHGWQRQPNLPTVQASIEAAITRLTGEPAKVCGSGRTDAGVHALNQVANFRTECRIPCSNLQKALNDILPPTVRIKQVEIAAESFHARYDARAKTYRYRILQAPVASPFTCRFAAHIPEKLARDKMAEAARLMEGEHDFTSFAAMLDRENSEPGAEGREARSMVRHIFSSRILWRRRASVLIYEVRGDGFLPHMVRNIAGTLIEVGRSKLMPQDVARIVAARDRKVAGPTAPAQGLVLVSVEY